jgi:hypothetical protein
MRIVDLFVPFFIEINFSREINASRAYVCFATALRLHKLLGCVCQAADPVMMLLGHNKIDRSHGTNSASKKGTFFV